MIWTGFQENLGVGQVATGDVAGKLVRRVNQVPVVLEGQHRLLLCGDLDLAESHGSSEVLLVEGP